MYINIMRDIQLYLHISVWDYRKYIYFCRLYTPRLLRDLSFVYIFLFGIIEGMYFLEDIFLWRIVGSILIFLEIHTPQLLWCFVSCIYLSVRDYREYIYLCRIITSIWISLLYISICSGLSCQLSIDWYHDISIYHFVYEIWNVKMSGIMIYQYIILPMRYGMSKIYRNMYF